MPRDPASTCRDVGARAPCRGACVARAVRAALARRRSPTRRRNRAASTGRRRSAARCTAARPHRARPPISTFRARTTRRSAAARRQRGKSHADARRISQGRCRTRRRGRDDMRRKVLTDELATEEKLLAEARTRLRQWRAAAAARGADQRREIPRAHRATAPVGATARDEHRGAARRNSRRVTIDDARRARPPHVARRRADIAYMLARYRFALAQPLCTLPRIAR